MSKKLQKKNKQSINFQGIIAFFGAAFGVVSNIIYLHYISIGEEIAALRNDVSTSFADLFALASIICWVAYVVLYAVKAWQQKR